MFLISLASIWHEKHSTHTGSKDSSLETPATIAIITYLLIQLILF